MTKQEAMHRANMNSALMGLGFSQEECDQLRRISLTLSRWAERECNEDIETRDDGSAWVTTYYGPIGKSRSYRIPNREAGALRRLKAIMSAHKAVTYYHQTDPRGAALYVVPIARYEEYKRRNAKPGRILSDNGTEYGLDCCYSSVGIAVY